MNSYFAVECQVSHPRRKDKDAPRVGHPIFDTTLCGQRPRAGGVFSLAKKKLREIKAARPIAMENRWNEMKTWMALMVVSAACGVQAQPPAARFCRATGLHSMTFFTRASRTTTNLYCARRKDCVELLAIRQARARSAMR